MTAGELARAWVDAGRAEPLPPDAPAPAEVADALRSLFDACRSTDPEAATRVAGVVRDFAATTDDAEARAVAAWVAGVYALQIEGKADEAVALLDEAAGRLEAAGRAAAVATVGVNAMHALALLGRYDEAAERGLATRARFIDLGDAVGAGLVEQNLGNVAFRRDRYEEAEAYYREALGRFEAAGHERQLGQIDACLATTLLFQHRFDDAERLYERALERAERTGQAHVQAIVECDLGCLELFRGRFDRALRHLEHSRRRYAELGMEHESAVAELELADAYLEVNLLAEAVRLYRRVLPTFESLEMRAEQARAHAALGAALVRSGRPRDAAPELASARRLYESEGNEVGVAGVALAEARVALAEGDLDAGAALATSAEVVFARRRARSRSLDARWLRGEAARRSGLAKARDLFTSALAQAETSDASLVAERCLTSLGTLARGEGDLARAERDFERAASIVEGVRALLPTDELKSAFVSDRLAPIRALASLAIERGGEAGARRALECVERGRSRALADAIGRVGEWRRGPADRGPAARGPTDAHEAALAAEIDEARGELNWLYNRAEQAALSGEPRAEEADDALRRSIAAREERILELARRLEQSGGASRATAAFDLDRLRASLGEDAALLEYVELDGTIYAFAVTSDRVEVVAVASEAEVLAAVQGFRLQMAALQCGRERLARHAAQLAARAQSHAARLYDLVVRPVARAIERRRLAVVPAGALHYVPFGALFDGEAYLVERHEVVHAPSAAVLEACLGAPSRRPERAVLAGVPDARAPRVADEVRAIASLFERADVLLGEEATTAALRELAPRADVLHVAAHGRFRADSPTFSALRLAGEWLTVRDVRSLGLSCELVTLSACETGVSAIAPGDEIVGLARGFLAAGAKSLLATLWTVADEETAEVMTAFYARLLAGERPAAALRGGQLDLLARGLHPFYWAPFVLVGRW